MTFGIYLKEKLSKGELSSKLIVTKLQLANSMFEKLDPVTLSRWINERTTPTLEKQLSAVQCLEAGVHPFLGHISVPSVPQSYRKVYEAVFDNIESSYHSIVAHREASASPLTPCIEQLSWAHFLDSVPGFFESTRSYERLSETKEHLSSANCVTFCSLRNKQKIVSHMSVTSDIECLRTIFDNSIDINFSIKSVVFNIGYFVCRKHYEFLFGLLLNHICSEQKRIEEFYMIVRGADFLSVVESFGGKLISANKENDIVGNIYLLKLDFLKTISNPFIFSLLKNSYTDYQEIVNDELI